MLGLIRDKCCVIMKQVVLDRCLLDTLCSLNIPSHENIFAISLTGHVYDILGDTSPVHSNMIDVAGMILAYLGANDENQNNGIYTY